MFKNYDEVLKHYADKVCVTYTNTNFEKEGFVSYVKAFDKIKDAKSFMQKTKDDGTFVAYANLREFPNKDALKSWAELHEDSLLETNKN